MEFKQVQNALENSKHKLVDMECLKEKLKELNAKVIGLEAKVGELKVKISKTKKASIIEFKQFDTYQLELNMTVTQFLAKERLKMKWLMWKHYQIEDITFLDGITNEPIFSDADEGKKKERWGGGEARVASKEISFGITTKGKASTLFMSSRTLPYDSTDAWCLAF